ncbi:MAG: peptidylprolyl isomerase [Gammaproteobacteria bacterium]|nr:peptidylprolyl isomerase [Gammaproteobacteria bacterium]
MNKIQHNSEVTLHYKLSLEDGTMVETSYNDEPLTVIIGDGILTEGMEQALLNHTEGNKISSVIIPEHGFGYPDENNQHSIPADDFPPDLTPEPGQIIAFDGPDNQEIPGTILEINSNEVIVDFSHPLAGHTLLFEADIINVKLPQEHD